MDFHFFNEIFVVLVGIEEVLFLVSSVVNVQDIALLHIPWFLALNLFSVIEKVKGIPV